MNTAIVNVISNTWLFAYCDEKVCCEQRHIFMPGNHLLHNLPLLTLSSRRDHIISPAVRPPRCQRKAKYKTPWRYPKNSSTISTTNILIIVSALFEPLNDSKLIIRKKFSKSLKELKEGEGEVDAHVQL